MFLSSLDYYNNICSIFIKITNIVQKEYITTASLIFAPFFTKYLRIVALLTSHAINKGVLTSTIFCFPYFSDIFHELNYSYVFLYKNMMYCY